MGAAALIPFVPNRTNYIEEARNRRPLTNYIDSKITLVTDEDPINYRTVVHAYDMTLETVMDEYTPNDNEFLRAVVPYERRMILSNLPDNYDKYELSVWRTERIGQIATVQPTKASTLTTKVFSRTYDLGFPTEVFINLTGRNV
jgi:hypothetical protein